MFRNWGFLLGEIWVLILLAALLGLFAGWLIWGRRASVDVDGLSADLDTCRRDCAARDGRIAALEADLEAAAHHDANLAGLQSRLDDCQDEQARKDAQIAALEARLAAPATVEDTGSADQGDGRVDYDGDGILEGADEGQRPAALDGPRGGLADDLKQIKGVGPKLEELCHRLGFYHFDQVASWTAQEVAWVDANLEGFKGRVSRDNWVEQARILASGGETEFASRVKDGDVY